MAPLVVNGICRFTLNGLYVGRPIANVIDMKIDTTGSTENRLDAIEDQAEILIREFQDHVMENVVAQYTLTGCSWLDLDEENGSTGEISAISGLTLPTPGLATGQGLPGNVALRVNKGGSAVRGLRKGRMYIVGVPEASTGTATPNTIDDSIVTTINADLALFLSGINQDGSLVGADYGSEMHVIHQVAGGVVSTSKVTSLTAEAALSSQRRRLRG